MAPDNFFSSIHILLSLIRQRGLTTLVVKTFQLWKRKGLAGVLRQLRFQWYSSHGYRRWVKVHGILSDLDRQCIHADIVRLQQRPLISVLMPTYNPPERWLRKAIESVRNQLYPDWELCVADDASTRPHVRSVLEEYQRLDPRIKIVFRHQNGHISAASNSAFGLATGQFVALLDHDDELPEHALYMVARAIEDRPELTLIYSDEDKIDEAGHRFGPYFKPDWNPDLLNAQNMISHLGVYRTEVVRAIGGFRGGLEGSQDWDLALRVIEQVSPSTIHHIPHVLYHWRAISGSTAIGHEEKSYVVNASHRAVREHLLRTNRPGSVETAFNSYIRVRYPLPSPPPLISIVLFATSDCCKESIRRTQYPSLEIMPCPIDKDTPAKTMNMMAKQVRGELLCFLDARLLPTSEEWLDELASQAMRPEIGAVGPMQIDADGNIQNALTVLCDIPGRKKLSWSVYQGLHHQDKGVAGRAALQQNVSILAAGALILRTETFRQLNGFDAEKFPETLFDLDLCLRLVQAGYRNLWTPYALMKWASAPKIDVDDHQQQNEVDQFRLKWRSFLEHDPAHNPNLSCGTEWLFPAFPPRIDGPWRAELKQ